MISKEIVQCTEDMKAVAQTGRMTLDIQVRAYDLLEKIMDLPDGGTVGPADMYCDTVATWCSTLGPAEDLCRTFHEHAALLDAAFDAEALKKEAQDRLTPFSVAFEKAVIKAKEAADLHDTAKRTFEIWQKGSFFARQRALKELRSRAGFRLESERIGNFVAKTFDLMNEAQAASARAQQAMFAADVSYKIKPGLFARITSALRPAEVADRRSR